MKKVLAWSDCAVAGTGFGVVSKHVLTALHNTGEYDIHHLAINFHGDFVDRQVVPWQMQPAKLLDPADPHGIKMFQRALLKQEYDIIWVLNDLYVTKDVVPAIEEIKRRLMTEGRKVPKIIYYYPVDCHVPPDGGGMIDIADVPVCYTNHGREETVITLPHVADKLWEIPHGVDTKTFHPIPPEMIAQLKKQYMQIDPNTFVVINVNRNSTRKQMQYSMLAFKEFKKKVPNSIMYLHTAVRDQGGDLVRTIEELGMSYKTDIIFPTKYSPSNPAPAPVLNRLYNTADLFLTTHLGEGWGLTITEAMAAGVPVVAPNNTSMPQQLGAKSQRGYMYPCKDMLWIDNSGFRPKGLIPDIVKKMMQVHESGYKYKNPKVLAARNWAKKHDWDVVTQQWVDLFRQVSEQIDQSSDTSVVGETI